MMKKLKDIAYDCRRATYLVEKKQMEGISLVENLQLKYHLTGCSVCRLYQQQSEYITHVLQQAFLQFNRSQVTLDNGFKHHLRTLIDERIA